MTPFPVSFRCLVTLRQRLRFVPYDIGALYVCMCDGLTLYQQICLMQVTNLRARGVQFLDVPDKYYTNLKERLKHSPIDVKEDIDVVGHG